MCWLQLTQNLLYLSVGPIRYKAAFSGHYWLLIIVANFKSPDLCAIKSTFNFKMKIQKSFSVPYQMLWSNSNCPFFIIWNKLSNEWFAIFVVQLLPYKLQKLSGKKFEQKKVRLFRRFELFSARTFFLDPSKLLTVSVILWF